MERYLTSQVIRDLERKMVFLGGPRQVGKTTLAKQLLRSDAAYFNWDFGEHREKILKMQFPAGASGVPAPGRAARPRDGAGHRAAGAAHVAAAGARRSAAVHQFAHA